MKKFKQQWEIHQDWQLLFPVLGLLALGYSSYKIANAFVGKFGACYNCCLINYLVLWTFKTCTIFV